jgi:nitrite reductase/ring-hydroxylating ferredoxin subunit/uncharacterized membrane protein
MPSLPALPALPTSRASTPSIGRLLDVPARWSALDPLAEKASQLIHRVLGTDRVADALHGRWLGHPLHPAMAQVPVGAALGASVLDAVSALSNDDDLRAGARRSARLLRAVGVAAAAPTALAGWSDFSDLHPEQQRTGLVHAAGNVAAVALWSLSLLRRDGRLLFAAGTAVAGASAALGGHLSQRWAAGANHAEDVPHLAPEGWHRLCALDELPDGAPHRVLLGDVPLVAVRDGERVRALAATCSHLSGPLDEGPVETVHGRDCIVCPWHGSAFSLDAGDVVRGPATAPQPRVEIDVHDATVFGRLAPL